MEWIEPIYERDHDGITAWLEAHVVGPRDGMAAIMTLALTIGTMLPRALIEPVTEGEFYMLEVEPKGDEPDPTAMLVGQVITAALNGDTDMVATLSHTIADHPDEAVISQAFAALVVILSEGLHAITGK